MIERASYLQLCEDFLPVFKRIPATERYAIALSGSHGKGTADGRSDFDFRIYYDQAVSQEQFGAIIGEVRALSAKWRQGGVEVDDVWPRCVADVDRALDGWMRGEIAPPMMEWTVWGYHILTDIYNQQIVEDPFGILAGWKRQLSTYPPALKQAILKKYGSSLRYWRADYHYANKVKRGDFTFLAYLTSRLTHDIMQIVYALNEFYYPGDGMNLRFAEHFQIIPRDFTARVAHILYPGEGGVARQYEEMCALIDDVLGLM